MTSKARVGAVAALRRRLSAVLVYLIAAVVAACAAGDEERISRTSRQALSVSVEHEIGEPAVLDGESVQGQQLACNELDVCLTVWSQRENSDHYLVGRLTGPNGPIGERLITFDFHEDYEFEPQVAARDNGDFLVAWNTTSGGFAARVDATDGTLIDEPPIVLGDWRYYVMHAASNVDSYVLTVRNVNADTLHTVRIVDGAPLDVTPPLVGAWIDHSLGVAPGQFAIALGTDAFTRFDLQTGAPLAPTTTEFEKYAVGDLPAIASDGTNYMLVWQASNKIYAARIRASDGLLLDPPDEFNQLSGGHVIATDSAMDDGTPKLVFDGTHFIALWARGVFGQRQIVGARISTAANRVSGQSGTPYEFVVRTVNETYVTGFFTEVEFAADYRSGFGLAAWTNTSWTPFCTQGSCTLYPEDIYAVPMTGSTGSAPVPGSLVELSYLGVNQDASAVASDGRDFFVVYRDIGQHGVYVRMIDGATKTPLGPALQIAPYEPTTSFTGDHLSTAWSGTFYVAVWDGYFQLFSCAGVPLGPPTPIDSQGFPAQPAVACNDDKCLIAYLDHGGLDYRVLAKRLSATDGSVLDATPLVITTNSDYAPPAVASDWTVAPSMRTFLVAWQVGSNTGLQTRRVRSYVGALQPTLALDDSIQPTEVALASDGEQFYAVWRQTLNIWGRGIDALTGLPLGTEPTQLGTLGQDLSSLTLAHDGSAYVATWSGTAGEGAGNIEAGIWGTRINSAGSRLDNPNFLVRTEDASFTSLGASSFGRSLLVFQAWNTSSMSLLEHGRFIDDDLGTLIAPPSQCATGSGGAGGAAGSGGTGGSAGASGSAGNGGAAGSAGAGGVAGSGGMGGSVGAGGNGGGTGGASGNGGAATGGAGGTGGATGGDGGAASGGASGAAGTAGGGTGGRGGASGGVGGETMGGMGGAEAGSGGNIAGAAGTGVAGDSGATGGASGGSPGTAGTSAAGSAGTTTSDAADDGSCGCRTMPRPNKDAGWIWFGLLVLALRRRSNLRNGS
jgi:hypothetical protein